MSEKVGSGNTIVSDLAEKVIDAVNLCRANGSGDVEINTEQSISAEWEALDSDGRYTVIGLYFYEDGVIRLHVQDVATKVFVE